MGWYHSRPDAKKKREVRTPARAESVEELEFPELSEDFAYLVDLLHEIGPVSYVGMGEVPLTEFDIWVWQQNHDHKLDSWEIQLLRQMSSAYLSGNSDGVYPDSVAPYKDMSPEAVQRRELALAKKIKQQFKKG